MSIYVAGHKGLVGSAICRQLNKEKLGPVVTKTHEELDLKDREKTFAFFDQERPEWVFLCAAIVGGIYANATYPVPFLLDNMKIQNNVIEASKEFNVKKLLFLGSSCIYPREAPQPIKEEDFLTSPLEKTNEPYAISKIAGIKLCHAFNTQFGTDYLCVMPCNLFGLGDNYHPENAHALPMLLRRFHEERNSKEVVIWGTGAPRREFMFADDLAEACLFLMKNHNAKEIGEIINIGTGSDCTILELSKLLAKTVGFKGEIVCDTSKPDGTMLKRMDVSKINALGWKSSTPLEEGVKRTYADFLEGKNIRL